MSAPDPALIARFRADMVQTTGHSIAPDARIALAVSGGPDSMAMLTLAVAAFPGQVIAATVDHQLRAESRAEAAMVGAHCAVIGIRHEILLPDAPITGPSVAAAARAARYRVLQRWARANASAMLATAHHIDDQAETFLMRAARGSGVAGLAAIRASQHIELPGDGGGDPAAITIIRPLLGWRVAELRQLVETLQVPFVDDPSNADTGYDRTRFRALLRDNDLLDPVQIARSAHHVAEADSTLRAIEAWLWRTRQHVPPDTLARADECWLDIADLPRELRRRLARAAIAHVRSRGAISSPHFADATNIEALLDALDDGRAATQAGVMASPIRGDSWYFRPAPPRRSR